MPSFAIPMMPMRRLRAFLCVSLMTFGSASLAHAQEGSGAVAPNKQHAKKLFEAGAALEKKADYAGALTKYAEAEQHTVTAGLRFHKGYCLEMIGKLAGALEEYDAADKLAAEQNAPAVHTAIAARLGPLRARVPQIALRVATPAHGADVQLDGVAVASHLLEGKAFRVDPGEHTVTAHAAGYKDLTRKVHAPERITTTVDLNLERDAAPAAAVAPTPIEPAPAGPPAAAPPPSGDVTEPPAESPRERSRALPIATTAGALALAGAGVAFFLVADGAHSDARTDCAAKTSCSDEQSQVRTFDALALGSFIGSAGLAIASVVLWTAGRPGPPTAGATANSTTSARVLATPTSLKLEGSF